MNDTMYSGARFVAIDDNPDHLSAIETSLEMLGTTCLDVLYRPADKIEPALFRDARVVFMDFHLSGLAFGSDAKVDNATIATVLTEMMGVHPHPYVLVVWTQYPDLAAGLSTFLGERLKGTPRIIPMAVLSIDKGTFLDLTDGSITDRAALKTEIDKQLRSNPSLAALLEWEFSAFKAASQIVNEIVALVPDASFSSTKVAGDVDHVLSRFASVAAGGSNALVDPRSAVSYALGPLLADQVLGLKPSPGLQDDLWRKGVTVKASDLTALTSGQAGAFNRMAHLASPRTERIEASDWGAIVQVSGTERWFDRNLGISSAEFVDQNLKLTTEEASEGFFILLRSGAECDFAQAKNGPIPFIAGYLVPLDPGWTKWKNKATPSSVKRSVTFVDPDVAGGLPFQLHFDTRVGLSFTATYVRRNWKALFGLRTSLMTQIIAAQASHVSRPGSLEF